MESPKEKPPNPTPPDREAERKLRFDAPHKPIARPWFWVRKKGEK